MSRFPSLAAVIPEGISGNVQVKHFTVTKADSDFTRLRAAMGRRNEYVPEGRYVQLLVNGGVMMSDTLMEQRTNSEVLFRAKGHVLIAGLGLGMIMHPIVAKDGVTRVTVIEKNPHVVKLVGPYVPKNVEVIEADIFEWKPARGTKFQVIYHDVWATICEDNLKEMSVLHRHFGRYVAPGGWQGSWMREELQAQAKRRSVW